MTDTNIEMTPAVRDRMERDASVAAGNAEMARLTQEFHNSHRSSATRPSFNACATIRIISIAH
jgi:hypothetical protein